MPWAVQSAELGAKQQLEGFAGTSEIATGHRAFRFNEAELGDIIRGELVTGSFAERRAHLWDTAAQPSGKSVCWETTKAPRNVIAANI